MLQLTAEILRDIIWDGGLKQLSYECGHKKLPTQWQEIHMLLLALHETLLRKAVFSYYDTTDSNDTNYHKFIQWMDDIYAETNKDQTSRFWVDIMHFLGVYVGYYFSV